LNDKPTQSRWLFLLLLLVAVASLIAIIVLHANQDLQWLVQILSAPFVVSLLGIVVQALLWEQRKQHEQVLQQIRLQHEQFQQEREHALQLGAVSGIAERVFNGYADFCAEYLPEVRTVAENMCGHAPGENGTKYSRQLRDARVKSDHYVWIPDSVDRLLINLEAAMHGMGVDSEMAPTFLANSGLSQDGQKMLKAAYRTFKQLLGIGIEEGAESVESEKSIAGVMKTMKDVLDVDRLTELRRTLIERAVALCPESKVSYSGSEGVQQE
jgi:hypothetical protein